MITRVFFAYLFLLTPAFAQEIVNPNASVSISAQQSPEEIQDYWTPERMKEAKPMPMGRPMPGVSGGGGPAMACTEEAMRCPDGSYAVRSGPDCAFAPCPGQVMGGMPVQTGIVHPATDEPILPDYPLDTPLQEPLSVRFLTEHRTALNGRDVAVRGIIIRTLLGEEACPSSGGMCAQQRIILADADPADLSQAYNLVVLLPEDDRTAYIAGHEAEIAGVVTASPGAVSLMKK